MFQTYRIFYPKSAVPIPVSLHCFLFPVPLYNDQNLNFFLKRIKTKNVNLDVYSKTGQKEWRIMGTNKSNLLGTNKVWMDYNSCKQMTTSILKNKKQKQETIMHASSILMH